MKDCLKTNTENHKEINRIARKCKARGKTIHELEKKIKEYKKKLVLMSQYKAAATLSPKTKTKL